MVYLMTNMSPNEFETVNYSQTETKLNSVKRCKTSQFLIELTNLVAAASWEKVSKFCGMMQNKVEGSHKLAKTIAIGNDNAFLQEDNEDLDIAEWCRWLIENVLMYWNYLYLSKEILKEKSEERKFLT